MAALASVLGVSGLVGARKWPGVVWGGLIGSAIWINGLDAHGRSGLTTGLMYSLSTGLLLVRLLRNQKVT